MAKSTESQNAVDLVRKAGILLESARGPIPNFLELLLKEPVKGNWWAHPKGKFLFNMTRTVRDDPDILVCRLIGGKITYVHRRLWPALVRVSHALPRERLAWLREEHSASGAHKTTTTPFPDWVPSDVRKRAAALDQEKASARLGPAFSHMGVKPKR